MEARKEVYYQSLYEMAAALNSSHAPEAIVQSVLEGVAKAMEAKGCSLMLLIARQEDPPSYRSLWAQRLVCKKRAGIRGQEHFRITGGQARRCIRSDQRRSSPVSGASQERRDRIHPFRSNDAQRETIGVIRVYTAEPRQFTMDDMYFVGAVANLGAIALENARLYEAAQKDYETFRRDMLEWRAALGQEWMGGESVTPSGE